MPQVYIVGAGPGSVELLTLAAYRVICDADVVLYDRLVSDEVLALAPKRADKVYVGKREGEQETAQSRIYQLFIRYCSASDGADKRKIVRLKGGDPLVFGRGIEEWLFLKELGCEATILPGLSSAIAVPGLSQIPLTARGISGDFCVVASQGQGGKLVDWSKYVRVDTLVILMAVKKRVEIANQLILAGRNPEESVAFIENGSLLEQRVVCGRLSDVADGRMSVSAPAVFVIGSVTKFCGEFSEELFSDCVQETLVNSSETRCGHGEEI